MVVLVLELHPVRARMAAMARREMAAQTRCFTESSRDGGGILQDSRWEGVGKAQGCGAEIKAFNRKGRRVTAAEIAETRSRKRNVREAVPLRTCECDPGHRVLGDSPS